MQDRHITPSDDTQRQISFSALDQSKPNSLVSASSEVSYPNIENLYIFRGANEVTRFLEENPFLIPILQEAYIHIKEYFPLSDIVLEVVTDPEILGYQQLVAFIIVVKQTAEEASQALDHLDEEWGLDAMDRAEDMLCITLEFRSAPVS